MGTRYVIQVEREISGRIYQCKADNADVKRACGCEPTKHWPEGGATGELDGHKIIVTPKGYTLDKEGRYVASNSWCARRAYAQCRECAEWHCVGHMDQHMTGHRTDEDKKLVKEYYPHAKAEQRRNDRGYKEWYIATYEAEGHIGVGTKAFRAWAAAAEFVKNELRKDACMAADQQMLMNAR